MNRDDAKVLFRAGLIAVFIVIAAAAFADEPRLPAGITCATVRAKVAEHGEYIAYAWARMQGYSRTQIMQARKCLK